MIEETVIQFTPWLHSRVNRDELLSHPPTTNLVEGRMHISEIGCQIKHVMESRGDKGCVFGKEFRWCWWEGGGYHGQIKTAFQVRHSNATTIQLNSFMMWSWYDLKSVISNIITIHLLLLFSLLLSITTCTARLPPGCCDIFLRLWCLELLLF